MIRQILPLLDGIQQLILIPHRQLHLLPLHALFELNCSCDFTCSYLPSARLGLELLPHPDRLNQDPSLLSVEHPQTRKRLYPDKDLDLLFAELESNLIAGMMANPTRIAGHQASKHRVVAAMQRPTQLFHFTGHGYHDAERPADSALALAGDEVLRLQDIFELQSFKCELVSLSACETGLTSRTHLIDEFVGLASGFLSIGATYVVSTLWSVDEMSTALLMIRFYQALQESTPAAALKQATQWLRRLTWGELRDWYHQQAATLESRCHRRTLESLARKAQKQADRMGANDCPYADPYYWAGFTLTGKVR